MKYFTILIFYCCVVTLSAQNRHAVSLLKQTPSSDPTALLGPPPDLEAPEVVCLNGLQVNLPQNGNIDLYASDFLLSVSDNVTPAGDIRIGIRLGGSGSGFPVDQNGNPVTVIHFDCLTLGYQPVELWAIDQAGNADYSNPRQFTRIRPRSAPPNRATDTSILTSPRNHLAPPPQGARTSP